VTCAEKDVGWVPTVTKGRSVGNRERGKTDSGKKVKQQKEEEKERRGEESTREEARKDFISKEGGIGGRTKIVDKRTTGEGKKKGRKRQVALGNRLEQGNGEVSAKKAGFRIE